MAIFQRIPLSGDGAGRARAHRPAGRPLTLRSRGILFGCVYARWGSFGVGIGLMLAPVVLGYGSAARILHDVAMGVLVCVATLAALEWPLARFVLAAPATWLLLAGRGSPGGAAPIVELAAGVILLVLAVIPSARFAPAMERGRGARARA